jgi:C1A family cysteine protease
LRLRLSLQSNAELWTGTVPISDDNRSSILFGVPRGYWPYAPSDFDKEPAAFCYAFAQNYKTISYYRLDPPGIAPAELLNKIKTSLAANLPSMFGFTVYSSISQASTNGKIPFPTSQETRLGGHAIAAVGFDDNMKIKNTNRGGIETKGALLIKEFLGNDLGRNSYGWLPYEFVLKAWPLTGGQSSRWTGSTQAFSRSERIDPRRMARKWGGYVPT